MSDNFEGSHSLPPLAFFTGWSHSVAPTPDFYRGSAPPIGAMAFYTGWSGAPGGGGGGIVPLRMLTGLGL